MADPSGIDYDGMIPNNVGLNADPRLRRALESWHPRSLDWWKERGPEGFQASLVYLRTAVSVEPEGWAKFGFVRMPEYRWGILLAPAVWIQGRPDLTHDYHDPDSSFPGNEPERFVSNYRKAGGDIEITYFDNDKRNTDVTHAPVADFIRKHLG